MKSTGQALFGNVSEIIRRAYRGVQETLSEHKAAGNTIAIYQDAIELIPPDQIIVSTREANYLKHLSKGDRVRVAKEGGWKESFVGTITLGPFKMTRIRRGCDWFYQVAFDEPQHDNSPDGPYIAAQIASQYLQRKRNEG